MRVNTKFNNSIKGISAAEAEAIFKQKLGKNFDVSVLKFETHKSDALLIFISGLVSKDLIDRDIIAPMKSPMFKGKPESVINAVFEQEEDIDKIVDKVTDGNVALFYSAAPKAIIIDFREFETRSVSVPDSESVIRGPKESFTENLATNITLVRRKLKNPDLAVKKVILGKETNTVVSVMYLESAVNKKVLKNVIEKLKKIDVKSMFSTGQIEQMIEDHPMSLLPSTGMTQKPDIVAAKLSEGYVSILCDGAPHAIIVPEVFAETFSTAEDYYSRMPIANFLRVIRVLAFIIGVFFPGTMVAIISFHQGMIPFVFLKTFIAATQETPLPEALEVFLLIIMFELIKEGGTRLPKTSGAAITIVGSLIIGDAAVSAGFISAPSVIIVAIAAVASLLINNLNEFVTLYRIIVLLAGAAFGLTGISCATIFLIALICGKESFGVEIMTNYSNRKRKNSILRLPMDKLKDVLNKKRSAV